MGLRTAVPLAATACAVLLTLTVGCSSDGDQPAATGGPTTPPAATGATTTGGPASTPTPTAAPTTPAAPTQQVIGVTVAGGQVNPAPGPVDAPLGTTVVIEVTTDVADELHVHGYDRTLDLPAGQPARLELPLTIPGQFEVELHGDGLLLFTLRVS